MSIRLRSLAGTAWAALALALALPVGADSLRVVTTTPDLAALAREVGGDDASVKSLGRGREDPHFVEARPSFIRELHRADVFVFTGLGLEVGWAPVLVRKARNSAVQPGGVGYVDASQGIPLLQVMTGRVDRSMGDVHPGGNPHYLLDPVNGIRVARRLRDVFSRLQPERGDVFAARTAEFEARVAEALYGEPLAKELGAEVLVEALLSPDPDAALADRQIGDRLGGWLGLMAPHRGGKVIADHDLWPYFAARFGIRVVGFLEPVPGITPTTRHLSELAARMKEEDIRVILAAAYFHPRYADKVASATGATVVPMANQVGARDGVDDYLAMIAYDVREVASAF